MSLAARETSRAPRFAKAKGLVTSRCRPRFRTRIFQAVIAPVIAAGLTAGAAAAATDGTTAVLTPAHAAAETTAAETVTGNFSYTPRLDLWQSEQQALARTLYLRSSLDLRYAQMGLRADGFVTRELNDDATTSQKLRRTENMADLSELFWDGEIRTEHAAWALRIGRQPIRWSQSWTLPSLDYFSGRRANRLFFEPLSDQLTHPDATKISYTTQFGEIELVRVSGRSPVPMPKPFAGTDRQDSKDVGLRVLVKVDGFDVTVVARNNETRTDAGLMASYAFPEFVAKAELGTSSISERFLIIGTDWFFEALTVGPQLTLIEASGRTEAQLYLPFRYSIEKWLVEFETLQYLGSSELLKDRYSSVRIGYEAFDGGSISIGAQSYRGASARPLGISESLTDGFAYGLRFEYTGGFLL